MAPRSRGRLAIASPLMSRRVPVLLDYDPVPPLAKDDVSGPRLNGEKDLQVAPKETLA